VFHLHDFSSGRFKEIGRDSCISRPMPLNSLSFLAFSAVENSRSLAGILNVGHRQISVWRASILEIINAYDVSPKGSNLESSFQRLVETASTQNLAVEILFSEQIPLQVRVSDVFGRKMTIVFTNIHDVSSEYLSLQISSHVPDSCHEDATSVCDHRCSDRGICVAGECFCHHQFEGSSCAKIGGKSLPTPLCGNGILDDGEECDSGFVYDTACCTSECKLVSDSAGKTCTNSTVCFNEAGTCQLNGACTAISLPDGSKCSFSSACGSHECRSASVMFLSLTCSSAYHHSFTDGACVFVSNNLPCSQALLPDTPDDCVDSPSECNPELGRCSVTLKSDPSCSIHNDFSKRQSFDTVSCEHRPCFEFVETRDGVCVYSPKRCSSPQVGSCYSSMCVQDRCIVVAQAEGSSCNDGNPCTRNDVCAPDGSCKGAELDCNSGDGDCIDGYCNLDNGQCDTKPKPDGTQCSGGSCLAGECLRIVSASCGNGVLDAGEVCDYSMPSAGRAGMCCPGCRPIDFEIGGCSDLPSRDGLHPHCFASFCKRFEANPGTCVLDVASFAGSPCGDGPADQQCDGQGRCVKLVN
jgi:hypothetical protein